MGQDVGNDFRIGYREIVCQESGIFQRKGDISIGWYGQRIWFKCRVDHP